MPKLPALLALALLLAGCATPAEDDPTPTREPPRREAQAPWWNLGERWTIAFELAGGDTKTVSLVNFANNTFGDPPHFWLGTSDRKDALHHVFFDDDPFLGRIHWEILAPHEKGMHSAMYTWPLYDGASWTSPILFGKDDLLVAAAGQQDGTFRIEGEARADGTRFEYDYDPSVRWFGEFTMTEPGGAVSLHARVTDHQDSGATGTYFFLRGRDYLDTDGGTTGESETFTVKEEGATSVAFLLDVRTSGPAAIEFVDPTGRVMHRETIPLGGASDRVVEVKETPKPGSWSLRYVGTVTGTIKVRGIIEYKATL